MASFLTDLAKTYVEKLINGLIAESSYICCFTCIANDFEEERARLEIQSTTVKQHVDVATSRGEAIQANALFWKKQADELIQEDTKTKQKCLFGFCPHIIWRYKRGKELTNKKEQIKRLIETGKQLSIGLPACLPGVERYSSQYYIPFKSRESKRTELLEALTDDSNYITGLQGMGGTGKTTLAKEIGKDLKQSKQFTQIIDTTVSFSPDIKKIQDDIAGPLGLNIDDCNESDRSKKLWSRLTNGEKILLILDDVWGDIDFNEIGIPYCDNHKGCRILVTTRNLGVCNRLGCSKTIQLDLLSEEDAWIMFQRHAGLSKISPKNFLEKGRKIANECKRLPVAIAAIASSLKGEQRPEEWDLVLNSLQKHMSLHGVDPELLTIYKCFQVSYDNLKNENAKRLFLMCSVFREDEKIYTEMLTRICIGAGIFGEDCGNYGNARNQFVRSRNKLIDSCLLLEVDQSMVKMHDLVRDAAQWIANKEIQTVELYDKNQKAMVEREENIKYLLCESKLKDMFSFKLDGSKLEILIVIVHKDEDCQNVKIEVPNSFFENIMGLRVFHLIHHHYSKLDLSLPHSIQSLKNIRSLLFTRVNLGDISILGNLQSLETLDLDGCEIDELPHGITKLEKLKLLSLKDCEIARNDPFEVIEGCSSLEELYFTGSFNNFCREITFPKFQRFDIGDGVSINESLSKCFSVLYQDDVFLSKTTLKYCMQEAEVLKLRRIEGGWRNIMPEIVPLDQGMSNLVKLHLRHISQLQRLIGCTKVSKVFSKLVVLKLYGMDSLEELCNGPLSFDSLNNLEKLSIRYCKHLKSLFKCNINLFNLKSVSLEGCPMLISLFQIIDDNESTMFQKLEVLSIKRCPELEIILPFQSSHDLPALKFITIGSCDKLKYIFGQDVKLGSLIKIDLDGLSNMIDIFPECYGAMTSPIKRASSISGDTIKPEEQSDPIKCNIFSWTDIYCCGKKYGNKLRSNISTEVPLVSQDQPPDNLMESNSHPLNIWERAQCLSRPSHVLCNVKEITLINVSKMKSLFTLSTAPRMLLEVLIIDNCDELRHIITIDIGDHHDITNGNNRSTVFPKLRELQVYNCEKLEYIIGHFTDDHQNHTEIHLHLSVLETFVLRYLPSLVGMCPKQYHTTFPTLKWLELRECPQFNIKSIGDFIPHHSVTRSGTTIKESSGNVEHFRALESLKEINEQQMNLALDFIELIVLPMMTCLFMGPKNSFSLQNLTRLNIKGCEKLKIVFPTSIIRWLPQLFYVRIEECKELKHIIEDDLENKKSSNVMSTTKTCFPKLQTLAVVRCNQLKYVFPISICKELPKLGALMITEADKMEEIFASEGDDHKVEIPNLKFVVFENLPSLSHAQGIHFQTVKHRFIHNCQTQSLASSSTIDFENDIYGLRPNRPYDYDYELYEDLENRFKQLHDESKGHDTCNEYPSSEITEVQASGNEFTSSQKEMEQTPETKHEFVENVPRQAMPSVVIIPTNSEVLMNEYQCPLGETDAIVKPSPENNLEGSTSEKNVASTLSTITETTKNELPIQLVDSKQKGIEKSVEDGTTSANAKTIKSSPGHLSTSKELINEQSMEQQRLLGETDTAVKPSQVTEISVEEGTKSSNAKRRMTSSHECGEGQIAIPSPPIAITKPLTTQDVDINITDQVSVNDDAVIKVTSIVEEQLSKDVEYKVSESKPSPIIPSPQEFQTPSMIFKGDPSQNVEDLSSSLFIKSELEQLVSKNHLDYENLSLLTGFLVKNPSVHLKDNSLRNRYKGCAYNLLAELLKFLETHSVLDVLGSCHSEFVELLLDARNFGFDKDWLDSVERRAMFPDIQISQDAMQKLLESKQQVTKEVEVLHLKIEILSQHVEDLKHQLTSSKAVLNNIIQQEAVLSAPIGY